MNIVQKDSQDKPHLLFIVNTTGSFISHRLSIAKAAINKGYKVSLATGDTDCAREIKFEGIEHYHIPLNRSGRSIFEECRLIYTIYNLLKRLRPNVIHNVTMKPVLYGGLINRIVGKVPCVNAITGLGFLFTREGWKASLIQKVLLSFYHISLGGKYSRTIFQNSDDLNLFVSKKITPMQKTCIMKGAGVPLDTYRPSSVKRNSEKINILFPARLLCDKGILELIEAASVLGPKYPVRFILAGGIDTVNPSAVKQCDLDKWQSFSFVDCIGYQKDMITLYQQSDIVCLPSYREGMPRALLEAQACGCPVVTTNVPGCREAIIDSKTGLLVKKGSSRALVEALEKLILDANLRNKMGVAARQFAEASFSIGEVVEQTLDLYCSLLAEKKRNKGYMPCKGRAH